MGKNAAFSQAMASGKTSASTFQRCELIVWSIMVQTLVASLAVHDILITAYA